MSSLFRVPDSLVLLFGMMVVALIATWLLPAGQFETALTDTGRSVVVPGTYARRGFRLAIFLPFLAIGIHHVWRYASRVRLDPLALALFAGLVGGLGADGTARRFAEGASELASTALLIGFARSIALILEDGQVLHTIVNGLAAPLQSMGAEFAAVGMLAIRAVINLFIPSGSGQAYVTMPLMAPIGDLVGVSRQVAVLAFQLGDGFANIIVPTNPVLMGILGIAGVPYDRWFRFAAPLLLKLLLAGSVTLVIAMGIGLS